MLSPLPRIKRSGCKGRGPFRPQYLQFESGEIAQACRGSALLRRSRGAGVHRGPDERPHFTVDGTVIVDFRLRARR